MLRHTISPAAIEAGINYNALLDIDHKDYEHPNVQDVHALKTFSQWTRGKISGRLDCKPKQVDKWLAASARSSQPIPYTAWKLWLTEAGLINFEQAWDYDAPWTEDYQGKANNQYLDDILDILKAKKQRDFLINQLKHGNNRTAKTLNQQCEMFESWLSEVENL